MHKNIIRRALLGAGLLMLSGRLAPVWTGASLFYDRHHVYKAMSDYDVAARVDYLIFSDRYFKRKDCVIDIAVLNHDILLAGHVPTAADKTELNRRIARFPRYRHLYNQVAVAHMASQALHDSWITTQIRLKILSNAWIDPKAFKIVTADSIVYIMGEANARRLNAWFSDSGNSGVRRVVILFKSYSLVKLDP